MSTPPSKLARPAPQVGGCGRLRVLRRLRLMISVHSALRLGAIIEPTSLQWLYWFDSEIAIASTEKFLCAFQSHCRDVETWQWPPKCVALSAQRWNSSNGSLFVFFAANSQAKRFVTGLLRSNAQVCKNCVHVAVTGLCDTNPVLKQPFVVVRPISRTCATAKLSLCFVAFLACNNSCHLFQSFM